MTNSPKNILLLSLSGIGNFVMQSLVFEQLKKAFPEARLTVWVAPRGTKALAEINPHIDEVIEAPIKQSPWRHMQHVLHLSKEQYDIGIVLSPGQLWKSAAYLYLAGIPRRVGNAYPWRGNSHSRFLLTDTVDEDEKLHDIEQNLKLLGPLGIKNPSLTLPLSGEGIDKNIPQTRGIKGVSYTLELPSTFQQKAQQYLSTLSIPQGKKLIGFHMGSASDLPAKRWPLENFVELGKKLLMESNAHILLFGGPDEHELKSSVAQQLGSSASIILADLPTTAALLQCCDLVVSNDSGLMHVAAAVGATTFGLFGPTDEKQTGPRGSRSFTVRAPGTQPVYHTEKNTDLGSEPHVTMRALTPAYVLEQLRPQL
jgi:lipopolysaccharide heptosyltransferase II